MRSMHRTRAAHLYRLLNALERVVTQPSPTDALAIDPKREAPGLNYGFGVFTSPTNCA